MQMPSLPSPFHSALCLPRCPPSRAGPKGMEGLVPQDSGAWKSPQGPPTSSTAPRLEPSKGYKASQATAKAMAL